MKKYILQIIVNGRIIVLLTVISMLLISVSELFQINFLKGYTIPYIYTAVIFIIIIIGIWIKKKNKTKKNRVNYGKDKIGIMMGLVYLFCLVLAGQISGVLDLSSKEIMLSVFTSSIFLSLILVILSITEFIKGRKHTN